MARRPYPESEGLEWHTKAHRDSFARCESKLCDPIPESVGWWPQDGRSTAPGKSLPPCRPGNNRWPIQSVCAGAAARTAKFPEVASSTTHVFSHDWLL